MPVPPKKPVIGVFGATGDQGGSVVHFILTDPEQKFACRAFTRRPDSPNALELKEQGVRIVKADLDDREGLVKAMEGCWGIYGMTDFWEHGAEKEQQQGRNLVDAAKEAGVKHVVWSTGDHSEVPQMDSKAVVDDYLKQSGLGRTSIYPGIWWEMMFKLMPPRYIDGGFVWSTKVIKGTYFHGVSVWDMGGWALAAFKNPEKYNGVDLNITSEFISCADMAAQFEEVTGEKAKIIEVTEKEFYESRKRLPSKLAENFFDTLKFYYEYGPDSKIRNVEQTYEVYPQTKKWRDVVKDEIELIQLIKARDLDKAGATPIAGVKK